MDWIMTIGEIITNESNRHAWTYLSSNLASFMFSLDLGLLCRKSTDSIGVSVNYSCIEVKKHLEPLTRASSVAYDGVRGNETALATLRS